MDPKLEQLIKRKDAAQAAISKYQGLLAAAEQQAATLREECKAKGLDPDQLDQVIQQLTQKSANLAEQIEQQISTTENAIKALQGNA